MSSHTKKVHKATWVSPDNMTTNQIGHICIASKFRRSLLDVRVKRGADVAYDHYLLVGKCRLKLKNHHTSSPRTSHKYNIEMLKDEETKNRFKLTLSNKFQALASLQENEQHPGEEEGEMVVNKVWQSMKNTWRKTCEETLARKTKHQKAYVSTDTLKKIEARKKEKDVLNRSRTRAQKAEAWSDTLKIPWSDTDIYIDRLYIQTRYSQIPWSDTLKPTERLSKASGKTEGTLWMTLQDKQRKQQAKAM